MSDHEQAMDGVVYSATILEHFRHPRNRGALEDADRAGEAHNALCGDRIRIALRTSDGRIAEARFHAEACAICVAAGSLLTERLRGMQRSEALAIRGEEVMEALGATLREERQRCATLPLEALHAALDE
jgi:NifU-like protein involved in Fe-S cluster formation